MELVNTFILPNKTVNTLQEALDFRFLTAKNMLEFEGLSIWTVKNASGKTKNIHLDSYENTSDFKEVELFKEADSIEIDKGHISEMQYFFDTPVQIDLPIIDEKTIVKGLKDEQ